MEQELKSGTKKDRRAKDMLMDKYRKDFVPDSVATAEFNNVSFYAAEKKKKTYILKNFSAKLKPGKITALASLRCIDFEPIINMILRTYQYPEYMLERGSVAVNGENTSLLKRDAAAPILTKAFNVVAPALGAGVVRRQPEEKDGDMTVKEFLTQKFFLKFYGLEDLERNLRAIGFYDIDALYESKYGTLGLSDMQRIKLAQDLAYEQDIAVLVYPTMCLNSESKYFLQRLLHDVMDTGMVKAVLLLDEDMEFVGDTADMIYVLEDGRIAASGTREEIISNTPNEFIRSTLIKI